MSKLLIILLPTATKALLLSPLEHITWFALAFLIFYNPVPNAGYEWVKSFDLERKFKYEIQKPQQPCSRIRKKKSRACRWGRTLCRTMTHLSELERSETLGCFDVSELGDIISPNSDLTALNKKHQQKRARYKHARILFLNYNANLCSAAE